MNSSLSDSKPSLTIAQILSLFYSISIVFFVCQILSILFPSLTITPPIPQEIVGGWEGFIAPEELERYRFLLSLVLLPPLLFLFNFLFLKLFRWMKTPLPVTANLLAFGALVGFGLIAWLGFKDDQFYYLTKSWFYQKPLLYGVLFIIMIGLIYLYEIRFEKTWKAKYGRWIRIIFIVATFALILSTFFFSYYSFPSSDSFGDDDHFDAAMNSTAQVMAGKPLLISSYCQYGLYGQLLEPIFRITGFSTGHFTAAMAILLCLSYLCIFFFLKGIVKNKLLAFLGFAAMLYATCYFEVYDITDPYWQYRPIRLLFPALMIFLTWRYFSGKKSPFIYYASFVVSALGMLWNLDTGIVIFGAWIAVLAFQEFLQTDIKTAIKKTIRHGVTAFLIFAAVVGLYCGIDYIRYGAFPDFTQYFRYLRFFYQAGFFCIPMPLLHPWNIVALIYLAAMGNSFKNLLIKKDTPETKLIFFLSILGLGAFSYYQGRSHDLNLTHVAYPAFLIITIYADLLLTQVRQGFCAKQHDFPRIILLLGILFIFLSSYFDLFGSPVIYPLVRDRALLATNGSLRNGTVETLEMFKRHTQPGERILILSYRSAPYYAETHTGCSVDIPGVVELFFRSDHQKLMNYVKNNQNPNDKIFVSASFGRYIYHQEVMEVINQRYQVIDRSPNGDVALYVKK